MATLTKQAITTTGTAITFSAADVGGDDFANNGNERFMIDNASGGAIDVTFVTTQTVDGLAVADRVVNVGAGVQTIVGPFDTLVYSNTVSVTYASVTSLTVAVTD